MPTTHTVALGDHLALLATQNGFGDVKPILNDPANNPIAGRAHPTILDVGEEVTIPDKVAKELSLPNEQVHKIVIKRIKTKLEVVFKTFRGGDTAATDAKVTVAETPEQSVSLDSGAIDLPTQPTDATAVALVQPPGDGEPALQWSFQLGQLGRSESDDGAMARLRNLGYYRAVDDDADDRERRSAVEEFQADQGVQITGKLDDATKSKIAEIYGC